MQGVSQGGQLVWLARGKDDVLACRYQPGMISPGCSASRAYEFQRGPQGWASKGMLISPCNAE